MKIKYYSIALFRLMILFVVLISIISEIYCQDSHLPLLDINKIRFDFGKTVYMDLKCDKIIFKNIGDTVLNIYHVDSLRPPFISNITFPDTLAKNDSLEFSICYRPDKAGNDSQRVFLRADTRLSNSIGLLFDISLSMDYSLPNENIRKLDAAVAAGRSFINSMLATTKVGDEAAVFSFWDGFTVNQNFTTNKTALRNSLPNNTSSGTAFYDACIEVLNRLKTRKFVKVMIALTDGEDNSSSYRYTDVINLAKANNIKIYTVGVGSSIQDKILDNIAQSTGGIFFKANSSKGLEDIYYKIFSLLSKNITLYFDVLGICSGPAVELTCDSTKYLNPGDTVSFPVYLRAASSTQLLNSTYMIKLRFNRTLLYPYEYSAAYKGDGILNLNGINTVNIDSLPLATVKFVTLTGDSICTDLVLDSLVIDSVKNIESVVNNTCTICINSCVRQIRMVKTFQTPTLEQNQPNPFASETQINFQVVKDGKYRLILYDKLGYKIRTLIDSELKPDSYSINYDAGELSSGSYYYILYTPNEVLSRTMNVIK